MNCHSCQSAVEQDDVACAACGELLKVGAKYRVECRIGEGSMGVVYRALDVALNRPVAIKLLHGHQANKPEKRERFLTECRAMAALDHAGIARIYEADVQGDQFYFVQEFISGEPLSAWLDSHREDSHWEPARRVAEGLLAALEQAHEKGIAHRDVNPNNVLVRGTDDSIDPVLIDFGMARVLGEQGTRAAWGGTPGYAAPEQILDPQNNDPRSDLYAVGALLYTMLSGGRVPYQTALYPGIGAEPRALLKAYDDVAKGQVELDISFLNDSQLPRNFAETLTRALRPDPDARFQCATEMRDALADATSSPTTQETANHDAANHDDTQAEPRSDHDKVRGNRSDPQKSQRPRGHLWLFAAAVGVAFGAYALSSKPDQNAPQKRSAASDSARSVTPVTSPAASNAAAAPRNHQASLLFPEGVAVKGERIYVADRGAHRIQLVVRGLVSTLAGTTRLGFLDGPSNEALFNEPRDVAIGPDGAVYVTDSGNRRIRKITGGVVTTIAGGFDSGRADGPAEQATFALPLALAFGPDGALYVSDMSNHLVRRIDLEKKEVSTYAGTGTMGHADGPLATAQFNAPSGIAFDPAGVLYVYDSGSRRLRKVTGGRVTTITTLPDSKNGSSEDNTTASRFKSRSHIAARPDGRIFLSLPDQHRIVEYQDGALKPFAGSQANPGDCDGYAIKACFRAPTGIAVSKEGVLYISDKNDDSLRAVRDGIVRTLAGGSRGGYADGPLGEAQLNRPWDLGQAGGELIVADWLNLRIRRVSQESVDTIAGSGAMGQYDGASSNAEFGAPTDVTVDAEGAIYVTDSSNHRIRKIEAGRVTTFAGSGKMGDADGPATQASFAWPSALMSGPDGSLYVADTANHTIRKIVGGQVTTIAGSRKAGFEDGNAAKASFRFPQSVFCAPNGAIYVADTGNHAIRRLYDGRVTTVAGTGKPGFQNGQLKQSQFEEPHDLFVSADDVIYVADSGNHRVRMITRGLVSTLAGNGRPGYRNGPAPSSAFAFPTGVLAVGPKVYVADSGNDVIRVIEAGAVKTAVGKWRALPTSPPPSR